MVRRTEATSVFFKVKGAKTLLLHHMREAVDGEFQWLTEYDKVAEWLEDNHGEGLVLSGGCGRGKSVLLTQVIPAILSSGQCVGGASGYYVSVYGAGEVADHLGDIKEQKIVAIDEVGVESEAVSYGNRTRAMAEVADVAERRRKLLMLTTNLDRAQLSAKYGERTYERIRTMCRWVDFAGPSMRKDAGGARPSFQPRPLQPLDDWDTLTDRQKNMRVWGRHVSPLLGERPEEIYSRYAALRTELANKERSGLVRLSECLSGFGYVNGHTVNVDCLRRLGLTEGQADRVVADTQRETDEREERRRAERAAGHAR